MDEKEAVPTPEASVTTCAAPDAAPEAEIIPGRLDYRIPALILTGMNLFLGLFSWVTMDLIERGLAMFA